MSPHVCCAPRLLLAFVAMLIALEAAGQRASGQAPGRPAAKKDDDRVARLAEMKQIAGTFHANAIVGDTRTPVALVPEPLHRWTDPTRENSDGALWAWRSSGRPIAIISIELYPQNKAFGTVWALEFTSLSTGPIEVEGGDHFDLVYEDMAPPRGWSAAMGACKGGTRVPRDPRAPAPANTEAERLRQMRDLLKRFSVREFYDITAQDYALRLLSHPIDRYADAASGLTDGAIFIYANGTNPEALLVIEARRPRAGSPLVWSYAAAPLTRAAPTVRLGQQDVWTHPTKVVTLPEDTYFLARKPRRALAQ